MSKPESVHSEEPTGSASAGEVELREVTKLYPGRPEPAIRELSFTIPAGEVCVLVGPSGSGKTTTMRLINRMIALSSGDILLGGRSVLERDPRALRREIGYVIQQVGLFPHQTVKENIATVPRLLGWDKRRVAARADELLELVGLDEEAVGERYPSQLSGGQRQRVGVARALAADPPLMLMDEPFGAIDPINRARLQDEFLALQQKVHKTVVFVTHDIDEAIKMGDRIAILREGGVLAQYDTPAAILTHPADDFVARFVGADRALKRLSLTRVSELDLLAADAPEAAHASAAEGAPQLSQDTTAHDALAMLLLAHGAPLAVVDSEHRVIGLVTMELLESLLSREANTPRAEAPEPAGVPGGGQAA